MYNNLNEFPLILGCLWTGFVLGIFYDVLRLMRLGGRFIAAVSDLLFAVGFFILTAAALFTLDGGRLRAYSLPVELAGFLIWQYAPGRLIRCTLSSVFTKLRRRTER